jgi:hypothetical protein
MKEKVKSSVTNITTEADINLISTIQLGKIVETKIEGVKQFKGVNVWGT